MSKLLAYRVDDLSEGSGVIVFAKSNAAARSAGSQELSDGDFHSVTATRLQWADEYAEAGEVPPLVMIKRGWWFQCAGCERRVSESARDDLEEGEPEIVPYVRRGDVFCNRRCCASFILDRRIRKKIEAVATKWWVDDCLSKYPGVELTSDAKVSVWFGEHGWHVRWASVWFKFPGSKNGDCGYCLVDDYTNHARAIQTTVPAGDLLAWHQWRGDDLDKVEWPKWFPRPEAAQ